MSCPRQIIKAAGGSRLTMAQTSSLPNSGMRTEDGKEAGE